MPTGTTRTPICSLVTSALMETLNQHTSAYPSFTHIFHTLFTASAFPARPPSLHGQCHESGNIIIPQTQNVTRESLTWINCIQYINVFTVHIVASRNEKLHFTSLTIRLVIRRERKTSAKFRTSSNVRAK